MNKVKMYLDKIFIILGVLILSGALYMKYKADYKEKKLINEYKQRMVEIQNDEKEIVQEDESSIESKAEPQIKTNLLEKEEEKNENVIGIIEIPKIHMTAPIGQGIDRETLKYSVGHFENTEMPGEKGNCSIIGHRSYTYGEFFNRLDEIEKEDKIIINYNNQVFNYVVKKIDVVEPEEVSVLEDDEDIKYELTLITCTPLRIGTHRLIIKCELER